MALPTLERIWSFDVNKAVSTYQESLFAIKDGLVTCGWTVVSSSGKNGTSTLVADLTDNWLTAADLVFANTGVAHSWIVIASPSGMEFLLDTNSTNQYYKTFRFSPDGSFPTTGLTTTNAPVASDELWMGNTYGGYTTGYVHVMASTDCFRAIICRGGYSTGLVAINAVKNPNPQAWTQRLMVGAANGLTTSSASEDLDYNDGWTTGTRLWRCSPKGVDLDAYQTVSMTYEIMDNVTLTSKLGVIDPDTSAYLLFPVGLFNPVFPSKGWRGQMVDMWWGQGIVGGGDTYPSGSSKQFVQFGDMVFPWDGSSTPLLT